MTTITVYRPGKTDDDEEREITVEVEGRFSRCHSDNPHELGYALDSLDVVSPKDFELTAEEEESAEEAIYAAEGMI